MCVSESCEYTFWFTVLANTMGPPLMDTFTKRTAPNKGQIFSSQNTVCQKSTPPYSGDLPFTDNDIGVAEITIESDSDRIISHFHKRNFNIFSNTKSTLLSIRFLHQPRYTKEFYSGVSP